MTTREPGRRALDQWAQGVGYASFEIYLQAGGGSVLDAHRDIGRMIANMNAALEVLREYRGGARPAGDAELSPAIGPAALARLEAEQTGDDAVDPQNAHLQGADHAC